MNIRNRLARSAQGVLNRLGYSIKKIADEHSTMEAAVDAIAKRNQRIGTVIDIGASNGSWSAIMMRRFPLSEYLLIEAQPVHEAKLREFCSTHPNARFSLVAAAEQAGTINFDASAPCAGQASPRPYEKNNIVVPAASVDSLVAAHGLRGSFVLKLDTHGYEVPILKGAARTLEETEFIIMECYNFRIAEECLLFHEMSSYLQKMHFRCIDLVNVLHRPLDNVLWQMDIVFARDTRPEFAVAGYS